MKGAKVDLEPWLQGGVDPPPKGRATSVEVKFTGRKIWGRWVEDPHGPWTFPVGDKYWQWCREEGPAEAYWKRGYLEMNVH